MAEVNAQLVIDIMAAEIGRLSKELAFATASNSALASRVAQLEAGREQDKAVPAALNGGRQTD